MRNNRCEQARKGLFSQSSNGPIRSSQRFWGVGNFNPSHHWEVEKKHVANWKKWFERKKLKHSRIPSRSTFLYILVGDTLWKHPLFSVKSELGGRMFSATASDFCGGAYLGSYFQSAFPLISVPNRDCTNEINKPVKILPIFLINPFFKGQNNSSCLMFLFSKQKHGIADLLILRMSLNIQNNQAHAIKHSIIQMIWIAAITINDITTRLEE